MNKEKFTIGTTIRNILLSDSDITKHIKRQIYPLCAPEDTKGDFIVYFRDKYAKRYSNMGIYEESCVLYITVVSDSYNISQELAIKVNDLLESYKDGFIIKMTDSTEDYVDNKYIQVLEFTID